MILHFMSGYWDQHRVWVESDLPPTTFIVDFSEPDCVCARLSVGHDPDCAWKQWKDNR